MRRSSSESLRLRSITVSCKCARPRSCVTVYPEYRTTAQSVTPSPAIKRTVGDRLIQTACPRTGAFLYYGTAAAASHEYVATPLRPGCGTVGFADGAPRRRMGLGLGFHTRNRVRLGRSRRACYC